MASTYVNDLRLNEMATGDQSGSWGTVTNTNLELIAEAFSFGTEGITTNANTHTTTIADGGTDPGRSMFLKYTGTLDSACTITIGPNTVSKLWFIENATSGSQNIIIKQGSGATITIPPGDTKAIYSDGAGSGAAMVDAFASLSVVDLKVQDDLTVTDDATIGGTLGVTGVVTANAGVVVDNFTLDGTTLALSSGDFTVDVAGDIILNADGGDIHLEDGAVRFGSITKDGNDLKFNCPVADGDIKFVGNDNGVGAVTALTLDMSAAGQAIFSRGITTGGGTTLIKCATNDNIRIGQQTHSSIQAINDAASAFVELKIDGSTLILNDQSNGDVTIGEGADLITTTASGATNTRIGTNAGDSIVADNAGVNNILIGTDAGTALDSGDTNIAIGIQALAAEDDHANNIAIGYQALYVQNAGADAYNVAMGYQAGVAISNGIRNLFIGASAGAKATTSDDNLALGYNSGGGIAAAALTGNANVSFGNTAGGRMQADSNSNVFIGSNVGSVVTTHDRNCMVGESAGSSTNSSDNTFIGNNAGTNITSGDANTILGRFNGNGGGLDIRTSSNNIVLSDGDGNPRGHFTSNGNMYIGRNQSSVWTEGFAVESVGSGGAGTYLVTAHAAGNSNSRPYHYFFHDNTVIGQIVQNGASAVSYATSSDYRLKENVVYDWDATTRLKQLKPARFNFITEADRTVDGFLAHEAQAVVPEAVHGTHNEVDDDGAAVMQGIDQSKLVPLLVKTIQELEARITALEGA